ncbi:hypothetical protein pb186bvf_008922 [Paramecium bursaria]
MRQRNIYSSNQGLQTIPFISMFAEPSSFWNTLDDYDPQLSVFSGRLMFKSDDSWELLTLELQPDKLIWGKNYAKLQGCFLKKFTHYDPQPQNQRHGLRLQYGQQLGYFLADNPDTFKKWFSLLKRFCILDKFNRKYKVLQKLRVNDPLFGQCSYSCIRKQDAGYFIVRIIDKDSLQSHQKQNLTIELSNLRRLSHTQIVYFIELYEDEKFVYQIFEYYIGIDLRQYLRDQQQFPDTTGFDEKLISDMMYGLLQAINHMHQRGVFHRDIKLDNLIIPDKRRLPHVVLGNFCYSETYNKDLIYKKCGTPGFVAPEIFKTRNYNTKIDIFSLGIVFFIMIFGKLPFEGRDQEEILKQNEKCEIDFKQEKKICKKLSGSGMNLLKQMLTKDPNIRISASTALNHCWFIKMDSKQKLNPLLRKPGGSLTTIHEDSVNITQSFYQVNGQSGTNSNRNGHSKQEIDEDHVEREFGQDTLSSRLQKINNLWEKIAPSKSRHQV